MKREDQVWRNTKLLVVYFVMAVLPIIELVFVRSRRRESADGQPVRELTFVAT